MIYPPFCVVRVEYKGYWGIGNIIPSYFFPIKIFTIILAASLAPYVNMILLGSASQPSLFFRNLETFSLTKEKPVEYEYAPISAFPMMFRYFLILFL